MTALRVTLVVCVFIGAFMFRFLAPDWTNDQFVHVAKARQVTQYGELPLRDFADPVGLLKVFGSAAAQVVFGDNLLGEALLTVGFLATGAALTFIVSTRAAQSVGVSLFLTSLLVAIAPRLYNYQKVFLPALALFVLWRYVDRPSTRRLVVVAGCAALAASFRLDHGVAIAAAAGTMLLMVHWRQGPTETTTRLSRFAGMFVLFLLPLLLYVAFTTGVVRTAQNTLSVGVSESRRTGLFRLPMIDSERTKGLFTFDAPPPPPRRLINVRWTPAVTETQRAKLERRHRLTEPVPLGQRTWQYDLIDASPRALGAILGAPAVEDTHKIDRTTLQLTDQPRESRWLTWKRSVPLLRLGVFRLFQDRHDSAVFLFYLFFAIPVVAVAVAVRRTTCLGTGQPNASHIITCVALAVVMNVWHLRGETLHARIPDAVVPNVVLGAWLLGTYLSLGRSRRALSRGVQMLGTAGGLGSMALTCMAVMTVGNVPERLERIGIWGGPQQMGERLQHVWTELRRFPPDIVTDWNENAVLTRYVYACTEPTDRLLVAGYAPDLYFFSGRAFAGEIFFLPGYWASPDAQRRTLARVRRHSVPIVVADKRKYPEFQRTFDVLAGHIARFYRPAPHPLDHDGRTYLVLVDTRRKVTGTYGQWDLPCFK